MESRKFGIIGKQMSKRATIHRGIFQVTENQRAALSDRPCRGGTTNEVY
jgi:hypothetical protein